MNEWYSEIPKELKIIFVFIFSVLIACQVAFSINFKQKKTDAAKELILRTNTWWKISIGIFVLTVLPKAFGTLLMAYISFIALREMLSISPLRASDRMGMLLCYAAVPIQYFLAYVGASHGFFTFIPIVMFLLIPIVLVFEGNTNAIGRSMSLIPAILILTVFLPSHLILVFDLDFAVGSNTGSLLVMNAILLIAFNDVFQFTWGKLLGRHKILPNISPNKTWEGFVLGVLTTATLAYFIRFLTPLSRLHAFLLGLIVGVSGFFGDAVLSAIKRDLKIKDTGEALPGHGGVMDRLDSLIIAVPVYYHILLLFGKT